MSNREIVDSTLNIEIEGTVCSCGTSTKRSGPRGIKKIERMFSVIDLYKHKCRQLGPWQSTYTHPTYTHPTPHLCSAWTAAKLLNQTTFQSWKVRRFIVYAQVLEVYLMCRSWPNLWSRLTNSKNKQGAILFRSFCTGQNRNLLSNILKFMMISFWRKVDWLS